jgi:hypothetical protein
MRAYLIIFTTAAVLGTMTYLLSLVTPMAWVVQYLANLGFLVFLTVVSDAINQRALEQQGRAVIIPYIASTIIKLIFSAVFLILFIKQNMSIAREIVFSFLTYYAVFSALEIVIVNKRLRLKKF